jgi:hypothetical protein
VATAVWRADWLDLVIGLVALPAVATLLMSLRDRSAPPLRLGAAGHLVTIAHVVITASLVGEAAALFYAAWRSSRRCTETAAARSPWSRTGCAAATTASAARSSPRSTCSTAS